MRRERRIALIQIALLALLLAGAEGLAGVLLAEGALHPAATQKAARSLSGHYPWQQVEIEGTGGVTLQGSLMVPGDARNYVVLLHGAGDTRASMSGIAAMFLRHNYAVLAADNRPAPVTYGLHEAPDARLWAEYLLRTEPVRNLYGLGESMGAAVLLQTLPLEPAFRAVVAECPFSSFHAIGMDRIQQKVNGGGWLIRVLGEPIYHAGVWYAQARYGVDLDRANPISAVRKEATPILLIHGLRDTNIPPQHSRDLLMAAPGHIVPWFVPRAAHAGAYAAAPQEFEERVMAFFESYSR